MRYVGLILLPAVLLFPGCSRHRRDGNPGPAGVEGQIMLSAPYGLALPDGVRLSAAQKLQRTLAERGWPNVELDTTGASQIWLRVPAAPGPKANKAIRDIQSLQSVPPIQLIPLNNVCFRTEDGIVGPLSAPFEYVGNRRFREMSSGRDVPEDEAIGGQYGFGGFGRTQVTGADILPGSIVGESPVVAFQIRPGHSQDWVVAARSLHALIVDGKLKAVLGPRTDEPPSTRLLIGSLRVKPYADETAVATIELPRGADSPTAAELAQDLARGAVPPPPVTIRVLYAGPRQPGAPPAGQSRWGRPRNRSVEIVYGLPGRINGQVVTAEQCTRTIVALQERARFAGLEARFEADGTKRIKALVRMFRGPRRSSGTAAYSRLIQSGAWSILRVRLHGAPAGTWSPVFEDGWVSWHSGTGAEMRRTCRVDEFERYLREDGRNVLIAQRDTLQPVASEETGDGREGGPAVVAISVTPGAAQRWTALARQDPSAEAAFFVDGALISRFRVADRPVNRGRLPVVRSRLLAVYGDAAPSGRGISEGDAQALAGLLNLPPVPVEFTSTTYRLVEREEIPPLGDFTRPAAPPRR